MKPLNDASFFIFRLFKLLDKKCEPITMTVPRKVRLIRHFPSLQRLLCHYSLPPPAVGPFPGRLVPGHSGAGARHGARRVAGRPQRRPDSGVHEGRLRPTEEPRIQSGEEERAGLQARHATQHVHVGDQQPAGKQLHPQALFFCFAQHRFCPLLPVPSLPPPFF